MRTPCRLRLLAYCCIFFSCLPLAAQTSVIGLVDTYSPAWRKYSLVAIANTVNGCTNANGCWQLNGALAPNKAAATTQALTLFELPARGAVERYRFKSSVACTGTTTLNIDALGTTASATFFTGTDFDLKAAVSNTNFTASGATTAGSDIAVATNIVLTLASTVENIDQTAAGCAFDVWVLWSGLP